MCKTPELAAQVTLMPIDRLGVDAAILFSDILIPVEAMGVPLEFPRREGSAAGKAIRGAEDVDSLAVPDPEEKVPFVMEAIRILRKALDGKVPLIGFSGAPLHARLLHRRGGDLEELHPAEDADVPRRRRCTGP